MLDYYQAGSGNWHSRINDELRRVAIGVRPDRQESREFAGQATVRRDVPVELVDRTVREIVR